MQGFDGPVIDDFYLAAISSECAHFSFINIAGLFLGDVEEVENAIMTHDCESSIAFVKCDCLESLLNFYLCQAQVTVEILAHHFQKG